MEPKTVLAIDPGSAKCGFALVCRDAEGRTHALWRAVLPTAELESALQEAKTHAPFAMVVVGSGTRSQPVVQRLRELMPSVGILVVDERDTSIHARERYWEENPRRGWRRIVPSTLLVPPEPVDGYVAQILAERVLQV